MSTSKHFDKICCIVMAAVLLITVLFVNGEALGVTPASRVMGYENRLFDYTKVHTIDLVVDDWEGFLETCTDEEYIQCAAVIDGEAYKNIALRAKGNTSLSSVKSYGNDRYSFKIEFDHYDSTNSYHGLDKLCLNNIIQDNTYMKDFLVYQMMLEYGAKAPLCSFAYITVNGEDWGLYLAVEAVEDSFLQRNYGSDYGELYKPDSMSMGGGKGNGKGFDMDDFTDDEGRFDPTAAQGSSEALPEMPQIPEQTEQSGQSERPSDRGEHGQGNMGNMGNMGGMGNKDNMGGSQQWAGGKEDFDISAVAGQFDIDISQLKESLDPDSELYAIVSALPENATVNDLIEALPEDFDMREIMSSFKEDFNPMDMGGGKGGFGGMSMGSSDVKLQYIDDSFDSYSTIFDSAKTDITDADKQRLIEALKALSEQDTSAVIAEDVIRYFVVHNFVCNGDSYTGSMIHNYYLYEEDGQLAMLPWDYNLAFGGFDGGEATSTVNSPIDTPVSGTTGEDRPMAYWIFSDEENLALYHEYFSEFLTSCFDSGFVTQLIDSTAELIAPYVEKDPTKFCTYEEFEAGVAALREFCTLRAESVKGQLHGSIPSTTEGQTDTSAFVNASHISLSDMGSMGHGMGGDMGGHGGREEGGGMGKPSFGGQTAPAEPVSPTEPAAPSDNTETAQTAEAPEQPTAPDDTAAAQPPTRPEDGFGGEMSEGMTPPDGFGGEMSEGMTPPDGFGGGMQGGFSPPDGMTMPEGNTPPI